MINSPVHGLQWVSSATKTRANIAYLSLEHLHFEQEERGLYIFPLKRFLGAIQLTKERKPIHEPQRARGRMLLGPGQPPSPGRAVVGPSPAHGGSFGANACKPCQPLLSSQVAGACCGTFPAFGEDPIVTPTEPAKGAPENPLLLFHIRLISMHEVSSKPRPCSGPVAAVQPLPARTSGHRSVVAPATSTPGSSSDTARARGKRSSRCSPAGSHPAALPPQRGAERRLAAGKRGGENSPTYLKSSNCRILSDLDNRSRWHVLYSSILKNKSRQ